MFRTRLFIVFAVGKLNKHNIDPQKNYFKAARWVTCYLKDIIYLELIYGQCFDKSLPISLTPYKLIGYENNNFAKDPKDWKLVIGYYFFFKGNVIEYIAIGFTAKKKV